MLDGFSMVKKSLTNVKVYTKFRGLMELKCILVLNNYNSYMLAIHLLKVSMN